MSPDIIGSQGCDFVVAILRYLIGRHGENYLPQHRDVHIDRASKELRRFLELFARLDPDSGLTYPEVINAIVERLTPREGAPIDPELGLCCAAMLVYIERRAVDQVAQSPDGLAKKRLESSRARLEREIRKHQASTADWPKA